MKTSTDTHQATSDLHEAAPIKALPAEVELTPIHVTTLRQQWLRAAGYLLVFVASYGVMLAWAPRAYRLAGVASLFVTAGVYLFGRRAR